MALTSKQKLFIEEYLQCYNASEAARRAGYSEKTAYSIGSRLLKNVEVLAEIKDRLDTFAMTANEVLMRVAAIARGEKPISWNKITVEGAGDEGADIPALSENFSPMTGLNALIKMHGLNQPLAIHHEIKAAEPWEEMVAKAVGDASDPF